MNSYDAPQLSQSAPATGYTAEGDVEALFCVALLNTLDTRQTNAVLKRYLALRDNAEEVLTAMGRRYNIGLDE